jgi:hypothetical protein
MTRGQTQRLECGIAWHGARQELAVISRRVEALEEQVAALLLVRALTPCASSYAAKLAEPPPYCPQCGQPVDAFDANSGMEPCIDCKNKRPKTRHTIKADGKCVAGCEGCEIDSTAQQPNPAEPAPIQLKPGKWMMRNGEIATVVANIGTTTYPWRGDGEGRFGRGLTWRSDGIHDCPLNKHEYDIIAPYIDPAKTNDGIEERYSTAYADFHNGLLGCVSARQFTIDFARQERKRAAIEALEWCKANIGAHPVGRKVIDRRIEELQQSNK